MRPRHAPGTLDTPRGRVSGSVIGFAAMDIDGRTLIGWGFRPGPWFKDALARAREMAAQGLHVDEIRMAVAAMEPPPAPAQDGSAPPAGVVAAPSAADVPIAVVGEHDA